MIYSVNFMKINQYTYTAHLSDPALAACHPLAQRLGVTRRWIAVYLGDPPNLFLEDNGTAVKPILRLDINFHITSLQLLERHVPSQIKLIQFV